MATYTVNPRDEIINTRVDQYTKNHTKNARDLAEVIDLATKGPANSLRDEESELCAVFRECIELYAARHQVPMQAVGAALLEWQAIEQ